MGRSQVSISIIVGLVIIIVLAGFFVTKAAQQSDNLGQNSENVVTAGNKQNTLEVFILNCVRRTSINAEIEYGLDAQISTIFIKNYISYYLPICFDDFKVFKDQGYDVKTGDLSVDAEITSEALIVDISYPLNFKKEDTVLEFDKQTYTFPRAVYEKINFNDVTRIVSADGQMQLEIPPGTVATLDGRPLKEVGVKIVDREFDGLENNILSGMLAYKGVPHGVLFSKPVKVTFFYAEKHVPIYVNENDLRLGYFDKDVQIWMGLPTEVDVERNMVTTYTTHFSEFATVTSCSEGSDGIMVTPTLVQDDTYSCDAKWNQDEFDCFMKKKGNLETSPYDLLKKDFDYASGKGIGAVPVYEEFKGKESFCFIEEEENKVTKEECEKNIGVEWVRDPSLTGTASDNDLGTCYYSYASYNFNCELKDIELDPPLPTGNTITPPFCGTQTEPFIRGYNTYAIKFSGEGNSCVALTYEQDGTTLKECGKESESGKTTFKVEPKCLDETEGNCGLLGEPVCNIVENNPEIHFAMFAKTTAEDNTCLKGWAEVSFTGVGVDNAMYKCTNKDAFDFVNNACSKCEEQTGPDGKQGLYWKPLEDQSQCGCTYSMRGTVKQEVQEDNTLKCLICNGNGKWEDATSGDACNKCEDPDLPSTNGEDPLCVGGKKTENGISVACVVSPPPYRGLKSIVGKVTGMSEVTGKVPADYCCDTDNNACPRNSGEIDASNAVDTICVPRPNTGCTEPYTTECNDVSDEESSADSVSTSEEPAVEPTEKKANGIFCWDDDECQSGICRNDGVNRCVSEDNFQDNEYCSESVSCQNANRFCDKGALWVVNICTDKLANGIHCTDKEQCSSGYCRTEGDNRCVSKEEYNQREVSCEDDRSCKGENQFCDYGYLGMNANRCTNKLSIGIPCSRNEMCDSDYCDTICKTKPAETDSGTATDPNQPAAEPTVSSIIPNGRCLLPGTPAGGADETADCLSKCTETPVPTQCVSVCTPDYGGINNQGSNTGNNGNTGTPGAGTPGGGGSGGGNGGGGNNNCPENVRENCEANFNLMAYQGKKITVNKPLDTRNKELCDFGYDMPANTPMVILGPTKDAGGTCWAFIESQAEINGESPDVYVKYEEIKEALGIAGSCTKNEDCQEGFICKEGKCIKETVDSFVEIKAIYGFSSLSAEDYAEAKKLDAKTVGMLTDSPSKAIDAAKANNIETFIIYTGKDFAKAVENDLVTGYLLPGNYCAEGTKKDDVIRDLTKQYAEFRKTNKKTPVMINFEKLDCAIDYLDRDKDKKKFADIILFNVKPSDVPDLTAPDYIIGQKKIAEQIIKRSEEMYNGNIAIIPVVDLLRTEELMDASWAENIGKLLLLKEENGNSVPESLFRGIIFTPWKETVTVAPIVDNEFKIAFVANQKADDFTVLNMVKAEKANVTIHLGNFGHNNAREWNTKIIEIFDKTDGKTNLVPYPYVGVKGTYDKKESWNNPDPKDLKNDYADVFDERFKAITAYELKNKIQNGLKCSYATQGLLGYKMTCEYQNAYFVLSGVGIMPNEGIYEGHDTFILNSVKVPEKKDYWKICGWNRANLDLRVGDIPDNENLKSDYYEYCLNNSAIVITGLESNYARTKTITDIEQKLVNVLNEPEKTQLRLSVLTTGEPDKIEISDKKGLIINSGLLGGQNLYSQTLHGTADWWASIVAQNRYVKSGILQDSASFGHGALFITFNVGKDKSKAKGEFKAIINGEVKVLDAFEIKRVVEVNEVKPKAIFDVKSLPGYISAFKNVFKIAKENYVINQDCKTNPDKCKTKAQCEDSKFVWDAVNNKCVECLVNNDCKCEGQVCTNVVKACEENKCVIKSQPPQTPQETLLYTFAIIGDYGTNDANERKIADMVKLWNPSFIVTTGDNTYLTSGQPYHSSVGTYYGEYINSKFYPSIGQNDVIQNSLQSYTDYFTLPGNERYYDFSKEKANFYILNTELEADGKTFDSVQGTWLKNKLAASTAKFDIVIMHRSPYVTCYSQAVNSDTHCSNPDLQWPFKDWGANIVISGHNNVYERLEKSGLTYLVNGVGGSSLGTFGTPLLESKFRYNQKLGAIKAKVYDSRIVFELVNENGEIKDTYELK